MVVAPVIPGGKFVQITPQVEPAERPETGRVREIVSPHEFLVAALVEQSRADIGWLMWHTDGECIVVPAEPQSPLDPAVIDELPEPPEGSLIMENAEQNGLWARWCRARGIRSCIVVPILGRSRVLGTIGLASCVPGALKESDLNRLQLVASLAVHARRDEKRLAELRRLFDEVSRTLENALTLDRALRLPPSYREIARSVGESLDISYCLIAIHDSTDTLTIRAAGGHRPPVKAAVALRLGDLPRCAEALRERHGVVLNYGREDARLEPERLALFTATTRAGVLLPFVAGPRTQGLLIIGEERRSRCQRLTQERVAILELVASRIAHIMRMSRRLEYERLAERRRQRQLTLERQRIAREVHDEVGQSLSGLLVHVRHALAKGKAGPEELGIIERAAGSAMEGARRLAYGFRNMQRGIDALEGARSFADMMLRSARCTLAWKEERREVAVAGKTLTEVSRVIKESVSNIVRHAQADLVRIRVQYPDDRIRVTIRDNGVGFSPDDVRPTRDGRGLGLVGSSERLTRLGGSFKVTSAPRKGTMIVIDAPRTPRSR